MRMSAIWTAGLVMLGLAVAAATPARAELKLCNETSYVIESAIAYETRSGFTSQGWWIIQPGLCRVIIQQELDPNVRYFTFGRAIRGHLGAIKSWGGRFPFCTGKGRFQETEHKDCESVGKHRYDFSFVDIQGRKSWTASFTEPDAFSPQKARVAGAQRLLKEAGYDIERSDGFISTKTKKAIEVYKKDKSLPPSEELTQQMFQQLIDEANKREEESGLELCNVTNQALWGAVGLEEQGALISRGWFLLPAGECAKVIKDKLPPGTYYAYAENETPGELDRKSWGGNRFFCVNNVKFDIRGAEDCALRGFEPRGFRKVDVQGKPRFKEYFTAENQSVPLGGPSATARSLGIGRSGSPVQPTPRPSVGQ